MGHAGERREPVTEPTAMPPLAPRLQQCSLFAALAPAQLARVARRAQLQRYLHGDWLTTQGEPADALHVITAGVVKLLVPADSGTMALVAIRGAGDVIGELGIIDGQPHMAAAEAIGAAEAVAVPADELRWALDASPPFMAQMLQLVAARLRQAIVLATDLGFLDLRGQIAKHLLSLAAAYGEDIERGAIAITLPISRLDLAAMTGAARESVSKQLAWFEHMGIIERRGRQIVVRDPAQLRRWIL